MRLLRAGSILAAFLGATSAYGDCTYTQTPDLNLTCNPSLDPSTATNCTITYAFNCQGACHANWEETGNVQPYFVDAPTFSASPGCGTILDQVGADTCTETLSGVKVELKSLSSCGDTSSSTGDVNATGSVVIVPVLFIPSLQVQPTITAILAGQPLSVPDDTDPLAVPVGTPFTLTGFSVTPAGAETFDIHVEGAGINLTRTFGAATASDGTPQDQGGAWTQENDVLDGGAGTSVTATQAGSIQFWVEFEGTSSQVATLTAVVVDAGSSDDSDTDGGSSSGSAKKSGCGSVPGESLTLITFAVVVGVLARRRRR